MRRPPIAILACLFATVGTSVAGQQQPSDQTVVSIDGVSGDATRRTSALRVETPPLLDGAVLDDPAWANAEPATGFVQTQPNEGEVATERTEVRIVFTDDTIYFGIVCYDRDPGAIIVTDSRRDSSLTDSDSVQLILDTFLTSRTASSLVRVLRGRSTTASWSMRAPAAAGWAGVG